MVTAIALVGRIKRILHFPGINNLKGNVVLLCKIHGMAVFPARKRRAVCQSGQHIISQSQMGDIGQQGTVDPATVGDDGSLMAGKIRF